MASVKASPPAEPNRFGFPVRSSIRIEPGGRFNATQATLRDLIRRAYDLPNFLIVGGPEWAESVRFDIVAKAEAGFGGDETQIREMLRALLLERFKMRVHTETRDLPIYALVVSRRDSKLGTQLRPSTLDCAAVRAKRRPGAPPPPDGSPPECDVSFKLDGGVMTMRFQGETMNEIARLLVGPETLRPVTNKSGLSGTFDGVLSFAPEPLPGFPRLPESVNGVSLFTALQEQFGLKLEPTRGPVTVLVVDGAERPTPE